MRHWCKSFAISEKTSDFFHTLAVALVWLRNASIPNFNFKGYLEVAQIYFLMWVGDSYSDVKAHLSQTWLDLNWNWAWQCSSNPCVIEDQTTHTILAE